MRLNILDKLDKVQKFDKNRRHLRYTILAGRYLAENSQVDPKRPEFGFVEGYGFQDFTSIQNGLDRIEPGMYNLMVFSYNAKAAASTGYPFELMFEGAQRNRYMIPIVYFHVNGKIDYFGLKKYCAEAAIKFELLQVLYIHIHVRVYLG